ncbi:MAG: hypothetical protein PVI40_00555 [Chlamydiota bacterium]|jgi:hypothetical protein
MAKILPYMRCPTMIAKTLDKMWPYRWFYIILYIIIATYFIYGKETLVRRFNTFSVLISPLALELGYIFVRKKKFKDEFSMRRFWGFFFILLGLKELFG